MPREESPVPEPTAREWLLHKTARPHGTSEDRRIALLTLKAAAEKIELEYQPRFGMEAGAKYQCIRAIRSLMEEIARG